MGVNDFKESIKRKHLIKAGAIESGPLGQLLGHVRPEDFRSFTAFAAAVSRAADRTCRQRPRSVATPRSGVNTNRLISVITCSRDVSGANRIRDHYERLLAGTHFEIIQITDAGSLCEGYNRGFARSLGEIIIFSHDDIKIVSSDFRTRLLAHLARYDLVGVAGTSCLMLPGWFFSGWPHIHGIVGQRLQSDSRIKCDCIGPWTGTPPIQALDGLFIAATRDACAAIPFDEVTFDGFHFYDLDFSYRAFEAHLKTAIALDILIVHDSYGSLDGTWHRYVERFANKYRGRVPVQRNHNLQIPSAQFTGEPELVEFHERLLAALESDDHLACANPRRNEQCPCGSGRRYKHCHGKWLE
jgi:hypothetical protein